MMAPCSELNKWFAGGPAPAVTSKVSQALRCVRPPSELRHRVVTFGSWSVHGTMDFKALLDANHAAREAAVGGGCGVLLASTFELMGEAPGPSSAPLFAFPQLDAA